MKNFIKTKILNSIKNIRKKKFQNFFENLYLFSLHGMGYGEQDFSKNGEMDIIENLSKKCKKPTIFDVGANKGFYAKGCKKIIPLSEIYCFEPSKKTFQILKNNLENLKQIKSYNIGLGDKKEKKILFYDREGSGLASLYNRKLGHWEISFEKKETVQIETLDSFCNKNSIKKIDLLKIDVEGNEFNVLKGAKNMLKNKNIKKIQFEFGGCNIDSKIFFRDFWDLLNKNYDIYRIIYGGLTPIKKYKENLEIFTLINYLAILK